MYELPHEFPIASRPRILGNLKTLQNYCLMLSSPSEMKILSALAKIPLNIEIELFQ